jgi:hypothetical protein
MQRGRQWGVGETYSSERKDPIGSFPASPRTGSGFATRGISLQDVEVSDPVEKDNISAPYVAPLATVPPLARPRPPWPVTTPLHLDRWHHHLGRFNLSNEYTELLHGIEFGFSYKSSLSITETRVYPNMRSAHEYPEVIDKKIEKELAAGRYKGPYTKTELESLIGPFIAHPLGVVKKDESS